MGHNFMDKIKRNIYIKKYIRYRIAKLTLILPRLFSTRASKRRLKISCSIVSLTPDRARIWGYPE